MNMAPRRIVHVSKPAAITAFSIESLDIKDLVAMELGFMRSVAAAPTDDPASWGVPLTTFDEFLQREKLALQEVFQ